MRFQRSFTGSNLMEYVVPLAVIGIAVGLGLYAMVNNASFFSNIMYSSAGKVDSAGGKISFGSGTSLNGVFFDSNGKAYINNNEGNQVRIPLSFYEKYKTSLQNYLNSGKFNSSSSQLGQETSGAVGIEDVTASNKANTIIYSAMIEMASDNTSDETAAELLKQMSEYGYKMGDIETELIDVKKQIDSYHEIFDEKAKAYWKIQKMAQDAKEAYNMMSTDQNKAALKKAQKQLKLAAEQYTETKENFKDSSTTFLNEANTYFTDLKNKTGKSYDKILEEIAANTEIEEDVKNIVLPIGQKIKDVKDSVNLIEQLVKAFNLEFDAITSSYEAFSDNFKSFEIVIDENAGDETFDSLDQVFLEENPEYNPNAKNNQGNGNGT